MLKCNLLTCIIVFFFFKLHIIIYIFSGVTIGLNFKNIRIMSPGVFIKGGISACGINRILHMWFVETAYADAFQLSYKVTLCLLVLFEFDNEVW